VNDRGYPTEVQTHFSSSLHKFLREAVTERKYDKIKAHLDKRLGERSVKGSLEITNAVARQFGVDCAHYGPGQNHSITDGDITYSE